MDDFGIIRKGCIITYSGKILDLLNPNPEDIDIESIASSLSKICRFGGHLKKHYSVAEHSVFATVLAMQNNEEEDFLKALLLHDAAEAYLGDVVKPLKNELCEYFIFEERMEQCIEKRFDVKIKENWDKIKLYDNGMLHIENLQLRNRDDSNGKDNFIKTENIKLSCWNHELAKEQFLTIATVLRLIK